MILSQVLIVRSFFRKDPTLELVQHENAIFGLIAAQLFEMVFAVI
jgi:hypothetical protein